MEMYADKFVKEGLTFDDVLLVPQKSDVTPDKVQLETQLTKTINGQCTSDNTTIYHEAGTC